MSKSLAEKILEFIDAHHAAGRTVYASNYLQIIKISPKHRDRVRVRGRHCEVQMGNRWDSINGCKLTVR